MISSDSQPIQFWPYPDETFNEKDVCGIIKQDCFCQIFNTTDTIVVQFKAEASDTGLCILRVFDSNGDVVGGIQLTDEGDYYTASFSPSDVGMTSGQSYYFQIEDSGNLEAETGVFEITGYDAIAEIDVLAATVDTIGLFGTGSSNVAVVVTTSSPVTCSVYGGTAPFSYLWEYASGDATILPVSGTSASTDFSASVNCGNVSIIAVWRCKVTDNVGAIAYTENVTITLTNTETTCL